ncbi:hypothetical protein [Adlercreutzia caecimuris]|jgi:hypothetical protein|uniref:hypothetical protein n=1 Tax=Adlercreutzia caecimuris TaxID=671266 RepID=UPI001364C75F|nr:hypothetical protein [Adlercreutzia caecimuris]NBJ67559.1 hypothetical protein [Adlercreutzia caecimuris]
MPVEAIIASVVTALVTAAGSVGGAMLINNKNTAVLTERVDRSNELLHLKIDRLSDRVDKHNGLIERMVVVEQSTKAAHKRIDGLEN